MSEHIATLNWKRNTPDFDYNTFDRTHKVTFSGGSSLQASSTPEYKGKKELANPEEMLAASLASCHMLTFLAIAASSKYVVDSYEDEAVAVLGKDAQGVLAVTKVTLKPKVAFSGTNIPDAAQLHHLHEKAHKNCFIANTVKCEMVIESQ